MTTTPARHPCGTPWPRRCAWLLAFGLLSACRAPAPAAPPSAGAAVRAAPGSADAATPARASPALQAPLAAPLATAAPVPAPAAPPPAAAPAAPGTGAAPPILPFDDAVAFAARQLFGQAALPPGAAGQPLVIDPLIDANTGARSVATHAMQERIAALVASEFPRYALQPFSTATLARAPLLLIGTLTAVDKDNRNGPGPRDWYRIWLTLIDLQAGRIVSKGFARARLEDVDATPTAFFQDSPAWTPDRAAEGYVRTCQAGKVGEPVDPAYLDSIVAAAMISDAMASYDAGRHEEAFERLRGIVRAGGGDQLRAYNGLYLASVKLGRKAEAARAFEQIVEHGFAQRRLAVKFLFQPATTVFVGDRSVTADYPMWLAQIARRMQRRDACVEVSGHTSRTGVPALNDRLSLMRAQYVTQRLDGVVRGAARRASAVGKGSREPISGLGTDDLRDVLDRRVEFRPIDCPAG